MKGFVVILAAMAVFIAAFIALSGSAPQAQGASFNESFSGAKLMLTSIELITIRAAQDCNWLLSNDEIKACIDGNASAIIDEMTPQYASCTKSMMDANSDTNSFSFKLDCSMEIRDQKGTIFKNEFSRSISGKKYS